MSNWQRLWVTTTMGVLLAASVFTAGPTFRADYRFPGTALTGFKPLGQADWKVENGEIVGRPSAATGGWLLVDGKEFQNLQLYASVKCVGGCRAGFLMRAEKQPDGGMKGILMSVTENDLVPYIVTIDGQGKEISREPLPAPIAAPTGRGAGAAAPGSEAAAASATQRAFAATAANQGRGVVNAGPAPPMSPELAAQYPKETRLAQRPAGAYVPGDYNAVEILLTDNTVQPRF